MGRGNCVLGQGPPSGQEGRSPAQGWFSSASRSSPELVLLPCGCLVGMGRLSQLRVQLLLQHRTGHFPTSRGASLAQEPCPRPPESFCLAHSSSCPVVRVEANVSSASFVGTQHGAAHTARGRQMSGFPPPLPAPPAHRQLPQTWVRVPFAFVVSPASLRAWQRAERSAHSANVRSMQQKSPEGEDTGLLPSPGVRVGNRLPLPNKPGKQAVLTAISSVTNTRASSTFPSNNRRK